MLIVHNFRAFPEKWKTADRSAGNQHLRGTEARPRFLEHRRNREAVFVVNGNAPLVMALAARMFGGAAPAADCCGSGSARARNISGRLELPLKKGAARPGGSLHSLFPRPPGLDAGLRHRAGTSSYVSFKVNLADRHALAPEPEGEYVLCFGRSMRDFDTFLAAMEQLPDVPAAITRPDPQVFAAHHARFTRPISAIPPTFAFWTTTAPKNRRSAFCGTPGWWCCRFWQRAWWRAESAPA